MDHLITYLLSFRAISKEDQQILLGSFKSVHFRQGEYLSHLGSVSNELYFINKGMLKITVSSEDEKDITYYFMTAHQFMGFLYSLYNGIPTEQGLQAVTDVEVLVISKEQLMVLFEQLTYFREMLNEIAFSSMVDMVNTRNTYLGCKSSQRYQLLIDRQPAIALTAPLVDIASYLGITPQSLSRIRNKRAKGK
jgi:CRP-like cAMP-binding protein